jgi:hypothetical protein
VAPVALLTGCLVTFNDYPEGDIRFGQVNTGGSSFAGASGDVGGGSGGGPSSGGMGALPSLAGSAGSVATGGSDVGGSAPVEIGGGAGEAGSDASSAGAAPVNDDPYLIDDFEDGDDLIFEHQGRKGAWFVLNDGKGMQTPEAGAKALPSAFMVSRSGSERGMHTSGGPFPESGALIGTTLASQANESVPYDLSAYQGIKLWVRSNSTSPLAAKVVRLNFVTPATTTGGGCSVCEDYWGSDIPLTSKWVAIDVPFSKLSQAGFGRPRMTAADLTAVMSLQFTFPEDVSFDLWLDDLQLY